MRADMRAQRSMPESIVSPCCASGSDPAKQGLVQDGPAIPSHAHPFFLFLSAGLLSGEQTYNKRARVGLTPGLTRHVAGFQVSASPCVYLLDSPGIMLPAVPSVEAGFRLALAGRPCYGVACRSSLTFCRDPCSCLWLERTIMAWKDESRSW